MKITQLNAENVKKIKVVEIKPDGSLVQITGRNAQGKTSVLDSIAMVLGGKDMICAEPIRKGTDKGKIVCKLDNGMTVTRTLTTSGGGALTVSNADGAKFPSPQAMLDKLYGKLSFDPLEFSRMQPKQQLETLRGLVGIDMSELDRERTEIFDKRTDVNRSVKTIESRIAVAPKHADTPKEEINIAALMKKLEDDDRYNNEVALRENALISEKARLTQFDARVKELESQLAAAKKLASDQASTVELRRKSAAEVSRRDTAPIREHIASADGLNRKVRENSAHAKLADELKSAQIQSSELTKAIDEIEAEKRKTLAAAKFPVDGLTFDELGVLLDGFPFSQASSAEQLRVSVAMGLAMNPKLKVLLIRDGSLLDADNLQMIAEMADGAEAQVWIERVDDTGKVGIVIEDGEVVAVNACEEAVPV